MYKPLHELRAANEEPSILFTDGPDIGTVGMQEINDKLLHHKSYKAGHAMKAAGTFPRASFKLLGAKGRECWFIAVVEHWFAEHLRLHDENPKWSPRRCMKEAAQSAEALDASIKQKIQSTYAHSELSNRRDVSHEDASA